jgi:hypothetical protein
MGTIKCGRALQALSYVFGALVLVATAACSDGASSSGSANTQSQTGSEKAQSGDASISGTPQTAAMVGVQYRFQPHAYDTNGVPLTFSVQNLPRWATFSPSSGLLTGTPASTDVGTSSAVTITAASSQGTVSLPPFSIQVSASAPLSITSPSALPAATSGGSYFYLMAASGGTPPYSWSLVSSAGSTGWFMTPEGWLESAPTINESGSVVVQVTDSANNLAQGTFSVVVNADLAVMNQNLATGGVSLPAAVSGGAYSHALQAAGGSGSYTWSIKSGSLPNGLNLSSNGVISGTPSSSIQGSSGVVLQVSDSGGDTATASASITLSTAGQAARPSYSAGGGFFVYQGQLYDPNGNVFRIRGVDRAHFDDPDQPGLANAQVNAVRFFMYDIGVSGAPGVSNYARVAQEDHINHGELPIITAANIAGISQVSTGTQTPGNLAAIVSWWVANEATFAPIMNKIAINIANEWGPGNSSVWASGYESAIAALRAAGYTCPLVIDTGGSGQDINDLTEYSQQVFNSDPQKNIIFSFHFYGLGEGPPWSTASQLTTVTSQLASLMQSTGAVFILGEFGPGRGIGPSPTNLAPGQIIAAAEANNLGWMAWAWDDNDESACGADNYWFSMTYSCGTYNAPSDLTDYGLDVTLNPTYGLIALASPPSAFLTQ